MSPVQSRRRRTTADRAPKSAPPPVEAAAGPPAPPRPKPTVPKATSDLVRTLVGVAESELALYHRDRALQEALQAAERQRVQIADVQARLVSCREALDQGSPLGQLDERGDLEDRIRALEGDEQAAQRSLEHAEQEARTLNAELHELNGVAEQRRQAVLPRLEPEVYRMVDLALRTGRQPVVTTLVGAFCSGCHLRLSATAERQLRASKKVGSCPHCRRLLYDPDWLQ